MKSIDNGFSFKNIENATLYKTIESEVVAEVVAEVNAQVSAINTISFANGSESAPSIKFANQPSTGLYHTTDNIHLTIGGTRKMSVSPDQISATIPFNSSGQPVSLNNRNDTDNISVEEAPGVSTIVFNDSAIFQQLSSSPEISISGTKIDFNAPGLYFVSYALEMEVGDPSVFATWINAEGNKLLYTKRPVTAGINVIRESGIVYIQGNLSADLQCNRSGGGITIIPGAETNCGIQIYKLV